MSRKILKSATDQRPFSMIYHDFYKSNLLDMYEKMVFIALKIFADKNNQCFPSIKTLAKSTEISEKKIRKTLIELEKKGVITKENRKRPDGGKSSNLYTLHDYAEIWSVGNNEEIANIVNEYKEIKLISEWQSKGYTVTKEKEPGTTEPSKETVESSPKNNQYSKIDNTVQTEKSQGIERYTLEQIKQLFDYDIMVHDNLFLREDINSVMSILHTAMNTVQPTIRIAGQDKPAMTVIGKLMKLNKESIMYAIQKYSEQTERIKNPTAYMLTILYNAPEQYHLDIQNQVTHDTASENPIKDNKKPKDLYTSFHQRTYDYEQLEKELLSRDKD